MDRDDLTVIYYTSNREEEGFELKIRNQILKCIGKTPLISVSQKPIDFGINICVGDVGVSDLNIYRQLQIGCQMAKTKFVCTVEADTLYPEKGYFDFKPKNGECAYFYDNVWILRKSKDFFSHKEYSLCAFFSNRKLLLKRLKIQLAGYLKWSSVYHKVRGLFFKENGWQFFGGGDPCINIKTGLGIRSNTGVYGEPESWLPYWGNVLDIKKYLWSQKN